MPDDEMKTKTAEQAVSPVNLWAAAIEEAGFAAEAIDPETVRLLDDAAATARAVLDLPVGSR